MRIELRTCSPIILLMAALGWALAVGEEPREFRPPKAPIWSPALGLGTGRLWTLDPGDLASTMTSEMKADLETLRRSKVPTKREAERMAVAAKREAWGIGDMEHWGTVSLLKIGINVPDFAARGNLVWVVRFYGMDGETSQEGWISSTTARVRWIFPMDKDLIRANTPSPKAKR